MRDRPWPESDMQRRDHSMRCWLSLQDHWAKMPPSTAMAWPIMKLAAGLQSQTTAPAISSGSPKRPIGSRAIIAFMMSGS